MTCVAGVPVCAWKSWAAKPRAVWNGNTRFKFQKRETGHFVATPTCLVKLRAWSLSEVQLPSIPVTQPKQHNHHLWYLATWHPWKENCSNHANGIFQVKCLNSVSQKRATPYLWIGSNKLYTNAKRLLEVFAEENVVVTGKGISTDILLW